MPSPSKMLDTIIKSHRRRGESLSSTSSRVGVKLSRLAKKESSWSAAYMLQAARNKISISKQLSKAIQIEYRKVIGLRPAVSGTWIPWRSKEEQRRVLSRLDGSERRHALLERYALLK